MSYYILYCLGIRSTGQCKDICIKNIDKAAHCGYKTARTCI